MKKGGKKKGNNVKKIQKIEKLTDSLKPIPFIKKKLDDLGIYEDVLKKSGLYDFTQIDFDPEIQTHFIAQLIVNYDPKKRCSFVNDKRINVDRPALARALKLIPIVKQQYNKLQQVDLDSDRFSKDDIGFLENFVMNWILLGEEQWETPTEIANSTRCIRDGHPEKLDSASLIWYKVEKELTKGDKLVDCYYASHLQYLIKSQRENLFDDIVNLKPQPQEHEQLQLHHNVEEIVVDEEVVKEDAEEEMVVDAQAFKVVEEVSGVDEIVEEEVVKEDGQEMVDAQKDFKVVDEELDVEEHGNRELGGNKRLKTETLEDEFFNVFEKHHADVLMMVDKLVSVENELKRIKELFNQRKETQRSRDEHELLAKPEENQKSTDKHELNSEPEDNQKSVDEQGLTAGFEGNQKSQDEIFENDASVESVSLEADESKEKRGGND